MNGGKSFSVYVIKSVDTDQIYVGMAEDPKKRLVQHNNGKSKYTRSFRPWVIIYCEDIGPSAIARKREKYLKSTAGKNFLRKINVLSR